ncbi:hypothetical protein HMN09_00386600 [Mycena chlorophos]|uniref:F-box domain-containing protein n=1 Tax=Mycena chlorophos TaxID=658473 RepID=A0A8H6TJ95_MYCCL|nr:hypothetical protein HMN09_00386600 [Mycena chlorophos]
MSPVLMTALPQELLHLIVDLIPNDDFATLHAVSQVCNRLRMLALPLAVRVVVLDPHGTGSQTVASSFLRLLQGSPDVALLVKSLCIVEGDTRRGRKSAARRDRKGTTYAWLRQGGKALSQALPLLSSLRSLSLELRKSPSSSNSPTMHESEGIRWEWLSDAFKSALGHVAPQLEMLSCAGIRVVSALDLADFISFVQATDPDVLKELKVAFETDSESRSLQPLGTLPTPSILPHWRPKLTSLGFTDDPTHGYMLHFSLASVDFASLSTLSLRIRYSDGIQELWAAHCPANNGIRNLRLWLTDDSNFPLGLATFFPRLTSLYVCGPLDMPAWGRLLQDFRAISTLDSGNITLETTLYRLRGVMRWFSAQADIDDWERLVQLLRNEQRISESDSPAAAVQFSVNTSSRSRAVRSEIRKHCRTVESVLRRLGASGDLICFKTSIGEIECTYL